MADEIKVCAGSPARTFQPEGSLGPEPSSTDISSGPSFQGPPAAVPAVATAGALSHPDCKCSRAVDL